MKLPKFLFCENPIADKSDGRIFVLHTGAPIILAEVFHFDSEDEEAQMECKSKFEILGALDYGDEYFVFGARFIEQIKIDQNEVNRIAGIMRRMADWYEAYLNWEDEQ